jgi:hypothetical protein
MTILGSIILSILFIVLNLASLVLFGLSYITKKYQTGAIALICQVLQILFYSFLAYLKGDFFLLSDPVDFTANLIFSATIIGSAINSLAGLKMYHQHLVIASIIIQLGIFLSAVLLVTQISDTAYNSYIQNTQKKEVKENPGFNPTDDFIKNKPKPIRIDTSNEASTHSN